MDFEKVRELAKKHLLKSHLKRDGNLLLARKLFIVNSALNWIFSTTSDVKVIERYIIDLEKFLNGEIELKWLKQESRDTDDYKKKQSKESFATSGSK